MIGKLPTFLEKNASVGPADAATVAGLSVLIFSLIIAGQRPPLAQWEA
jgi:hypothetical protein